VISLPYFSFHWVVIQGVRGAEPEPIQVMLLRSAFSNSAGLSSKRFISTGGATV